MSYAGYDAYVADREPFCTCDEMGHPCDVHDTDEDPVVNTWLRRSLALEVALGAHTRWSVTRVDSVHGLATAHQRNAVEWRASGPPLPNPDQQPFGITPHPDTKTFKTFAAAIAWAQQKAR